MAAYKQLDTAYEMRLYLATLHQNVGIMDTLLQRHEKHGLCGLVWIVVLGVTHYADDLKRASISGVVHAKVFADGIFVGEVFPDERFIHNRHWARGAGIGPRE